MGRDRRLHAGRIIGAAGGAVAGALVGAPIASWTGALVGAYGGIVSGATAGGGFVGSVVSADAEKRREALATLGYGLGAALGAVLGYWIGTMGIPRLPPMAGYFAGLAIGSLAIGLPVNFRIAEELLPPGLPSVLTTAGAGGGAWLGTVLGHPAAVAGGLVVGCLVGLFLYWLLVRGAEATVDEHFRQRLRGGRDYDWPCGN